MTTKGERWRRTDWGYQRRGPGYLLAQIYLSRPAEWRVFRSSRLVCTGSATNLARAKREAVAVMRGIWENV